MAARSMTEGTPWVHIFKFSLPLLAGALLQQLYSTVDTMIVGNFTGEAALSAVGTTNTLTFFFLAIAIGLSSGNGVLVAQSFGAENIEGVRRSAATGLILLPAAGVFCTVIGIVFSRWAYTDFIAVPPEILEPTLVYFRICCLGLFFLYGYNAIAAVLRSVGDSAAILYLLLLASILNVVLDLWLVAYLHKGVAGAAVATVISQAVSMIAGWIYMHKRYPFLRFTLHDLKFNLHLGIDTFKLGFPMALQLVIVAIGISFIMRAVNSFGQVMTATFTAGQRIELYLHLPANSLMTALATYTGQNVGAGRLDRVKQGAVQGVLLSLFCTVVLSMIILFSAETLPAAFALGPQASEYCTEYLRANAYIVIVLSLYVPLFGVFQGTRHVFVPMAVAFFALSLRVAATYIFKDSNIIGYRIIWWNGIFGFSIGCIITYITYFRGRWQKNALGRNTLR